MTDRRPDRAFVDTSVFMRFFVRDDEAKAEGARSLLEQAEAGDTELHVNHLSFAELAFALRSGYAVPKAAIVERLRDLLAVRGIRVPERAWIAEAIETYARHNVGFADAYFVADMKRRELRAIYAYDKDFDKLGVRRLEP